MRKMKHLTDQRFDIFLKIKGLKKDTREQEKKRKLEAEGMMI
jgi:hypothetical protein